MFGVGGCHRIGEGEGERLLVATEFWRHCYGRERGGVAAARATESSVVGGKPTLGRFGELDIEGGIGSPELDADELLLEVVAEEGKVLGWAAIVDGVL